MSSASTPLPGRPRGRREHKKHATRRELLAAGRRLFGEKGLYESSIEDLSRRAGVAKGTLYGYFTSKEELIEAVVTSGFRDLLECSQRAAEDAGTHADVVTGIAEAHLAFFAANPDLMRVFHQVRGLLKFKRPEGVRLRAVLVDYLAGIARLMAPRFPDPQATEQELLDTAILLFGAVSGIASTRASLAGTGRKHGPSGQTVRALGALISAYVPPATGPRGRAPNEAAAGRPASGALPRAGKRAAARARPRPAVRSKPRPRV